MFAVAASNVKSLSKSRSAVDAEVEGDAVDKIHCGRKHTFGLILSAKRKHELSQKEFNQSGMGMGN